jgi:hypothetical protein
METEKQGQGLKCNHCGKTFNREELHKHESTCKK